MTFGQWEFDAGASIHEHSHVQEAVWHVVAGKLEVTVDGVTAVLGAGMSAVVASSARHSVRAVTSGKALAVDHPVRDDA